MTESLRPSSLPRPTRVAAALIAATAVLLLGACASTPAPTDQMAVSEAAVAQATGAGGAEFAPLELGLARDKLHRAQVAMIAKEYPEARRLAQQAQVDAQLAVTKSRAGKAGRAATELQEGSRVLREELDRKAK
jgi:ABC-type uncharacterized transport system auxiliary subunit